MWVIITPYRDTILCIKPSSHTGSSFQHGWYKKESTRSRSLLSDTRRKSQHDDPMAVSSSAIVFYDGKSVSKFIFNKFLIL